MKRSAPGAVVRLWSSGSEGEPWCEVVFSSTFSLSELWLSRSLSQLEDLIVCIPLEEHCPGMLHSCTRKCITQYSAVNLNRLPSDFFEKIRGTTTNWMGRCFTNNWSRLISTSPGSENMFGKVTVVFYQKSGINRYWSIAISSKSRW